MHLRHEILLLGILPITDRLRALNITHLNRYYLQYIHVDDTSSMTYCSALALWRGGIYIANGGDICIVSPASL